MALGNPKVKFIPVSVEFEVQGEVQGLYFLEYCREECLKLGLCGWVKNTNRGTIIGKLQGPKFKVREMIFWLTNKGPPGSRVHNCYVYNYQYAKLLEYKGFKIRFSDPSSNYY